MFAKDQHTHFTGAVLTANSSVWFSVFGFGWGYCAFALPAEVLCESLGAKNATPKQSVLAFELGKRSNEAVVQGIDVRGENGYRMGRAFAAAGRCGTTFQASSSSMRLAGCSAMRSST